MFEITEPLHALSEIATLCDRGAAVFSIFVNHLAMLPSLRAEEGIQYTGAVGQIVAAALQTKGLIDQAKILEDITLLKTIAALGFLFSLALGIGSVAVFGNYKQGLYLLLGPPFFYFMVLTTTETDGVRQRVGDREYQNSIAEETDFLRYIKLIDAEGGGGKANISLFFAAWDSIVTEVTQTVVSLLLDTKNRADLRFAARERALNWVLLKMPTHPGFLRLVIAGHVGECSSSTADQMTEGQARHDKTPVQLRPKDDLQVVKDRAKLVSEQPTLVPLDHQSKEFLLQMKDTGDEAFSNVTWKDGEDQVATSCNTIWNWTAAACRALADKVLKPESFKGILGDRSDVPWGEVNDDVKKYLTAYAAATTGADRDQKARDMLAAYILKNTLNFSSHSALQGQVFGRSPFNYQKSKALYGVLHQAEAHGGFFQLQYFGRAIPYIQGLLLYLLSVAFPFFAIFLVLPGRATTFLTWCSLWAWVKSWDIGFALVHVCRDIFWHSLAHRTNTFHSPIDWKDPSSVYAIIYNNDPLNSLNTYWEITSFLTVLVPLLTAHLCLGATEVFSMFKGSIDQTAARFRGMETSRAMRHVGNEIEPQGEQQEYQVASMYARAAMERGSLPSPAQQTQLSAIAAKNGISSADISPAVGTTMTGEAIAQNDSSLVTRGVVNVAPYEAAAAYKAAAFQLQAGTSESRQLIEQQINQLEAFEREINAGRNKSAPALTLPRHFPGAVALNEVDPESGKKWSEVIRDLAAKNPDRKLVLAHAYRGLPSFSEKVIPNGTAEQQKPFIEGLKRLYGDNYNENITWNELLTGQGRIARGYATFLTAPTDRVQQNRIKGAGEGMSDMVTMRELNAISNAAKDNSKYQASMAMNELLSMFIDGTGDDRSLLRAGRDVWKP